MRLFKRTNIQPLQSRFSLFLLLFLILVSLISNIVITGENEFSILSLQMLKGHLYLPEAVGDAVLYKGNYCWHLGPLPALLLIPLSFLTDRISGNPMPQGILNAFLVIGIIYLAKKIAAKYGFDPIGSRWMGIAVTFASVFFLSTLMPWAWHFSQTVTFFFGLLSLHEFTGRKNPLLIGIYHAAIFMTRFTAGFGILFYFLSMIFSKDSIKNKLKKGLLITLPIIFSGIFLLWYNYARFENIFDNGYTTSNNWVESSKEFRYEMFHYGLFNIRNVPTNLYYYFFSMPDPVLEQVAEYHREIYKTDTSTIFHLVPPFIRVKSPGVSFFVVSPIFLLIFMNKLKTKDSLFAAITGGFILVFLLTYYWTGWTQIGPRYMIDLLPFLYVLLLESFKNREVTQKHKFIIALSTAFNILLFMTI